MTGTEPENGASTRPGLARSLFRVSLPRWRGGQYSLSKLFFNFYFLAMGSFIAIAIVADFIITTAQQGITDDYSRRFMRGTITLIEDELYRHPRRQWAEQIKVIDEKFYYRLGTSSKVLVIGPLSASRKSETQEGLPLDLRLRLWTWGLIGAIFAVALWFWVRPVWRDLEALRQTARLLGDGKFEAPAPQVRTQLLAPLAETLHSMNERVLQLLATHRELSCGISHELRTPIARMRFALEMLPETPLLEERQRLWAMMEADLDELDQLIDTSLTYARFEREIPEAHFSSVRFADWLADEVESIRLLGRQLDIAVDCSALPAGLHVDLDRKAMPYALRNLLRNAFKYAQQNILVSAELVDEQIRIHVDDDGIGIPEEEREHVFSAFSRLDRSRDRATGGYGLGLAIARRVMELHGGTACAGSAALGGARITLSWRAHQ